MHGSSFGHSFKLRLMDLQVYLVPAFWSLEAPQRLYQAHVIYYQVISSSKISQKSLCKFCIAFWWFYFVQRTFLSVIAVEYLGKPSFACACCFKYFYATKCEYILVSGNTTLNMLEISKCNHFVAVICSSWGKMGFEFVI